MAWIIGIDEAGYGPNLGPFVMTLVACRVPDEHLTDQDPLDLWRLLEPAVRREGKKEDGRLLINDSKVVHAGPRGMTRLEQGVLATLGLAAATLADLLTNLQSTDQPDLAAEVWYTGTTAVPGHACPVKLTGFAQLFGEACQGAHVGPWRAWSVVICPRRFNTLVAAAGSKSAVPAYALARLLLVGLLPESDGEPVHVYVDKQGGRNSYAAQIQQGLPRGLVVPQEEGMARSVYDIRGLDRAVRLTFEPRADSAHFAVALASMTSKYLRELFMAEFNTFWQSHVPGLKPTAGYPGDASRFFEQVRPALERLAILETDLWRQR